MNAEDPGHRSLADLRREYTSAGIYQADLTPDPYALFGRWLADARAASDLDPRSMPEPNAMVVATAPAQEFALPSCRYVLLKGVAGPGEERPEGFVFYTGYDSRKGVELFENPHCSLAFGWLPLERQVRVEGTAERVPRAETEAYFASRPRESQIGAWASPQSQEVEHREALDALYTETEERFADVEDIPAPERWGGFRVVPLVVEFWQGRKGRMHDRLRYRRATPYDDWGTDRLAP